MIWNNQLAFICAHLKTSTKSIFKSMKKIIYYHSDDKKAGHS